MDPGKEIETIIVEPIEHPIPARREPAPEPYREPVAPAAPTREPEKVPA